MAKYYWLQWSRYDDSTKGRALPGGYISLKDARKSAMDYVKVNHPIGIDGSDEIVAKFDKTFYAIKSRRISNKYAYVRIPILKDGSLSKAKLTKANIVSLDMMTWLNE